MMGMQEQGIAEKTGKNSGRGWGSCSLPPRKNFLFQQGLKLDLQKDFLIETKGVGHRLGAWEGSPNHTHAKPALA